MVESGNVNKLAKQLLFAIVLSMLTLFSIWKIDYLPFSAATRAALSDALVLPGALVARLFYPEGIHTGRGSPAWAYVGAASNAVFYLIVWFLAIRIVNRICHRKS
jgi:hypothetical protein